MRVDDTPNDLPIFLSRAEAAARLGVGAGLLDRLIRAGEIHAIRLHRRVIIPASSLRDLDRREAPE